MINVSLALEGSQYKTLDQKLLLLYVKTFVTHSVTNHAKLKMSRVNLPRGDLYDSKLKNIIANIIYIGQATTLLISRPSKNVFYLILFSECMYAENLPT